MKVFDIETDGFLDSLTKIHCINVYDQDTGKHYAFNGGVYADGTPAPRDGTIEDGLTFLESGDLCGHNVIRFDIPAIQKLYPHWRPRGRVFDTQVACDLIYTDMEDKDQAALRKGSLPKAFVEQKLVGKQKLKAWGYRLGVLKGDFEGPWEHFTPAMDEYARQDPVTTLALLNKVESKNYSPEALELEHRVAHIIFRQIERGFAFDMEAAMALVQKLQRRRAEIVAELQQVFKPWYAPDTKKGSALFTPKGDNEKMGYTKGAPLSKVKLVVFNPGSRRQIADRLMTLHGWQPTQYTDSGEVKIDDEILSALPYPEAKPLAEFLMLEKRIGYLSDGENSLIRCATKTGIYGRPTGDVYRIHGQVATNGAVTGRMAHSRPNLNAPKVKVGKDGKPLLGLEGEYGYEFRSLFGCFTPGLLLVGCDAEGLELRMLAHYMAPYDGGAYAFAVANGKKEDETDVHNVNKKAAGLNSRDKAKTFIYALLYGAGDYKLGTIVYDDFTDEQKAEFNARYKTAKQRKGGFTRLGRKRRARLMENLPALDKLTKKVKAAVKEKGYLRGLDGRLLHIRAEHAALNTLLQSGGAIVMKKALVLLDDELTASVRSHTGNVAEFVANVHDEFQLEVNEEIADDVGKLAADCIRRAGEHFKLRCPLAGSYAVGRTWADTH